MTRSSVGVVTKYGISKGFVIFRSVKKYIVSKACNADLGGRAV
jgi:hypothetical protein